MKRAKQGQSDLSIALPFELPPSSDFITSLRPKAVDREEAFFLRNAPTAASRLKSKILVDSFLGWASVMLNGNPVALWYLDLYCGRGTYKKDGSSATPLELFDKVSRHSRLPNVLKMLFNDSREASVFELRDALMKHQNYGVMRHKPIFNVGEVNEDLVAELRTRRPLMPTYAFIDPFGYKGVTRNLIHTILQDYGCDVMFFFSYHVIKRTIKNPNNLLRGHLEALLGADRVKALREMMDAAASEATLEKAVLDSLKESMRAIDSRSVLTFAFRRPTGYASHHLAFVSKHPRGFEVAKDAMARNSWMYDDNIPSLEYFPPGFENALLHVDPPTIRKLMDVLVERRGGTVVSVDDAYLSVLYDTPYYRPNVREAIVRLVRDHRAELYSSGQRASLRGTKLPREAMVRIPLRISRLDGGSEA